MKDFQILNLILVQKKMKIINKKITKMLSKRGKIQIKIPLPIKREIQEIIQRGIPGIV